MTKRYNNYHKHDHISSLMTTDSNAKCIDYLNRIEELEADTYFTTNHGTGGDIFEANTLCQKRGIHCKFGIEGYIVPDPLEKDRRNYHIILIPTTNKARKKLNLASSHAHEEGYYYRPRFFMSDLLENFEAGDLYITTACIAGIIRDDDSVQQIFEPLVEKYGKNIMLEVQSHNVDVQKELNQKAYEFSKRYGLYLIAANDSHYIYPEQKYDRDELIAGKRKGDGYNDEDEFILDYPSYEELFNRFRVQGVLSDKDIEASIEQTLIFDECEDIELNKDIKMPSIYPPGTDESVKLNDLKKIISNRFPAMCRKDHIPDDMVDKYRHEIAKEFQVIKETSAVHSDDYFLLNYKLMHKAIDEYGGVLTRSGRGSGGAFLINKVLGMTEIDRLAIDLPIYSERFMSTARLLENRAMPDIDYNIIEQEPFVKASKDLLGEHGCYPMIAYGTLKESEAVRNTCRARKIPYALTNAMAMNIDKYRDDPEWSDIINDAQKYIGTIVSCSPHPCAYLLFNGDIREEIGVFRIGGAKGVLCALITSDEADEYKYLKNDYLVVTVWDIINRIFKAIHKPIMSVQELVASLDEKVWDLFANGITSTLNQVDGEWATGLVMEYKPQRLEELAQFVACIRPSFNSFRDDFIHRRPYTTGSHDLDNILRSTNHFVLFQENLMQYFEWLGVGPAESIGLIKKISKKKIKQSDFDNLTDRLRDGWVRQTGSIDGFDDIWEDMQSMMAYGFNSPHGTAYALDCLYCAYLKSHYPIEYYTEVFNIYEKKEEKTRRLAKELDYFGLTLSSIKFRHSQPSYTYDRSSSTIYKGLASVKNLNRKIADELYELGKHNYKDFYELLKAIDEQTSVQSDQLEILIKLDFFSEFGNPKKLLYQAKNYKKWGSRKSISKENATKNELKILSKSGFIETDKLFKIDDSLKLVRLLDDNKERTTSIVDKMKYQREYLGYIETVIPTADSKLALVVDVNDKYFNRIVELYRIRTGESEIVKVKGKTFEQNPFKKGDVIQTLSASEERKWKKQDDKWVQINELETILKRWRKVEA